MRRLVKLFCAAVAASCVLFSEVARADEHYACRVLLCLANPAGPMAEPECVPSIKKLFRDLLKGKAFPTCIMVSAPGGGGGGAYANLVSSYYDMCPEGTSALGRGALALEGTRAEVGKYLVGASYREGIGSGDELVPASGDSVMPLPGKTCVGRHFGSATVRVSSGSGDSYMETEVSVGIYDRVVLLDPLASPRAIDVYVDDRLYRRVRY